MTLLCVPILFDDPALALNDAREARDRGADLVEFRIDSFFTGLHDQFEAQVASIASLIERSPIPCIVTCRPVLEGGQYDGPDDARISLFEHLSTRFNPTPQYIDLELATYARSANIKQKVNLAVDHPAQVRQVTTGLILSAHDFHTRPPDLIRRIENMIAEPAAAVIKVAYRARSLRDNLELLDILAEIRGGKGVGGKPMIALAMGPFGLMSRVLAPKFDAFLTFASLRRNTATAPGQPIITELLETYRFRSISSTTKVFGVIGYPVEHSLSPLIHNAGFDAISFDAVYLPLPVPPEYEHLKATLPALIDHVHLDFHGCSVTMPHKEHLLRLATELFDEGDGRWSIDPLARACGSANTLTITRDPRGNATRINLSNTDASALASILREHLSPNTSIDADTQPLIAILGAGGTARAAVAAALSVGARVVIINRTHEKALALANDFNTQANGTRKHAEVRVATEHDLMHLKPAAVINCTSLGMQGGPAPDASPLNDTTLRNLPASAVVLECVYRPLNTPLLKAASAAGLRTIDGANLFIRQGAEQFEQWTSHPAPSRLFDRIVREELQTPTPQA